MPVRLDSAAAEEVDHRDAGDLLGILEGEEHAGPAALVGGPLGDVLTLEQDAAAGDLVGGVAHQDVGEGRLPGPVGSHQGVDLAALDGE